MGRVAKRVQDKRVLKLLRAFLTAGVLEGGLVSPSEEGTPQGGPLSPLLSNLMLDDLDRELDRRGLRFVRYADDCNVYVGSLKAGQRVMASLTHFLTRRLRLTVNQAKSAVGRPWERQFLGFSFLEGEVPKRIVAPKAQRRFKNRVRDLTQRTRGRSLLQLIAPLARYLTGWVGYFGFCETPWVFRDLDAWIRRRLRSYVWRQWRRGRRRYRALRRLGLDHATAAFAAWRPDGPWRMSATPAVHAALPTAYFADRGLPFLWPKLLV